MPYINVRKRKKRHAEEKPRRYSWTQIGGALALISVAVLVVAFVIAR